VRAQDLLRKVMVLATRLHIEVLSRGVALARRLPRRRKGGSAKAP